MIYVEKTGRIYALKCIKRKWNAVIFIFFTLIWLLINTATVLMTMMRRLSS